MSLQNDNEGKNLISDDNSLISEREDFQENVHEKHRHRSKRSQLNSYLVESKTYDIASGRNKKEKQIRKKKSKIKKVLLIVAACFFGLIAVAAVTIAILYNIGYGDLTDKSSMKLTPPKGVDVIDNGNYIRYKDHLYRYKDSMTSILFMGVDKKEKLGIDNGVVGTAGQADALYLIAIDTDNGITNTFQISRSAMCDVDLYDTNGNFVKTENEQVCLSYAYGDGKKTSAENCIKSIRRIFYGLPVAQTYYSMDIDGISAVNDSIGGVTVVSPVTYGEFKKGKTYNLKGDKAEAFVRSRSSKKIDANTNRMARQKTYIDAFVDKTVKMTKETVSTPVDIYNDASPYSFSNLSASKVSYLAIRLLDKGVVSADIQKVPGKDKKGKNFVEYYINDDLFFDMIVKTFYVMVE